MAPGIAVRPRARRSLRGELRIDPPPGPAKEPDESSDQKPPFLVPGSERKASPPPRFPVPPRLGQRAVRSETAQETATPSRSSELLQTVPQETRCSVSRSFQIEHQAAQPSGSCQGFPLQELAAGSKEQ